MILIWIQSNWWGWGSITYPDVLFVWLFRNIFSHRNSKPQNDFKTAYQHIFSLLCLFLQISQWCTHWVISAHGYICYASSLSHVWLSVTPWTIACQAPLSMGLSRQEYWSGLPCPPPGDLPNPETEPRSPSLQVNSLPSESPGKLWL